MTASCDPQEVTATVSRHWSHDALQKPIWEGHPKTEGLPFVLYLICADPEYGDGLRSFGRLTAGALAGLICGDPHEALYRARTLVDQVGAYDWTLDKSCDPRMARKAGKRAERDGGPLRVELRALLSYALERRVGERLGLTELATFLQLAARLKRPDRNLLIAGLQVCEICDRVFRAAQQNARRCPEHRNHRAPTLHPASNGGWHTGTYCDPADGSLAYFVLCGCGREFVTCDVRRRLCPACGSQAGRVRRHRGKPSGASGRRSGALSAGQPKREQGDGDPK